MKRWQEVYDFWIGAKPNLEKWFKKDPALDDEIRRRFGPWLDAYDPLDFESWKTEPRSLVSLVILLDQFPRNAFRGTPKSFQFDMDALDVAREGLEKGFQDQLNIHEALFLSLPFEHSEDITDQQESVRLTQDRLDTASSTEREFAKITHDYAVKHLEVIEKFGRFPHRNAILGRASTPEELEFLKKPGSSF